MRRVAGLVVAAIAAHAGAQGSEFALRCSGAGGAQRDRVRIAIDDNGPCPDAHAPRDVFARFAMSGGVIGLVFDGAPTTADARRCVRDSVSGQPPLLVVTHLVNDFEPR